MGSVDEGSEPTWFSVALGVDGITAMGVDVGVVKGDTVSAILARTSMVLDNGPIRTRFGDGSMVDPGRLASFRLGSSPFHTCG